MMKAFLIAAAAALLAAPAIAQGEIQITQAKALAGNVTPGDAAGYPVTISQAGSYVLAGNLTVTANQIGLQITAANVTIDLNGFTLEGNGTAATGIFGNTIAESVTVQNGTIRRFRSSGINGNADFWIVDNVRVLRNAGTGITGKSFLTVTRSHIILNSGSGIYSDTGVSGVFAGNNISNNKEYGIVYQKSTVTNNTINENGRYAIYSDLNTSGFGQNTIYRNNNGGTQVLGAAALEPNFCLPQC